MPTKVRISTQGPLEKINDVSLALGEKISRHSPHSPTSCLLLYNPATFFVLEQKGQGGKRTISQKQTKRRRWRLGEQYWFLFCGCQREKSRIWQNIHQHSSTLSSGTNTSLNFTFFPFPASGVVQMKEFYSCLSFLSLSKLGMVGWFPFFLSFVLSFGFSFPFLSTFVFISKVFCFVSVFWF